MPQTLTISFEHLKAMAVALMPCMSTEETRYYLNGVAVQVDAEGKLHFIATDGHRLGHYQLPSEEFSGDFADEIIIAAPAIKWLRKQKPARIFSEEYVEIVIEQDRVSFTRTGELPMFFRTIEGTFPDWRRVIPKQATAPISTFNAKYLSEITKAYAATMQARMAPVGIACSDPFGPAFITGENTNLKYIIMPMRCDALQRPYEEATAKKKKKGKSAA